MIRKLTGLMLVIMLLASASAPIALASEKAPVIAVAWTWYLEDGRAQNLCRTLDYMGVEYFILEQVKWSGADYDGRNVTDRFVEDTGMLREQYAQALRADWRSSNVREVVSKRDFDMILFTGGEDVCPSLQKTPDIERNGGETFDATRDISDFILMSYCLENDIPVLGVCRGMQVLAVASGCSIVQDIPDYYEEMGKKDNEYHRMPRDEQNKDFVAHDVAITDKASHLYAITRKDVIKNAPSWHHQAVLSVEGTELNVTATTLLGDIEIIEAVERTDCTFAMGIQFHPEASVIKYIDHKDNLSKYTDKDECIAFFRDLIDYMMSLKEAEAA